MTTNHRARNHVTRLHKNTMPTASHEDRCDCRTIHEERISQARQQALPDGELESTVQLFKALADQSRMRILWSLSRGEMCVCDLAAFLKVSESAVSHQLRLLKTIRLVNNRREGSVLYYRLNDLHVEQLIQVALEHVRE